MSTLRIEHAITDFEAWQRAFGRFAEHRARGGVLSERIMQPVDDARYVLVDLEFADVGGAQRFERFLQTQVWSDPASSPALEGTPRSRVVDEISRTS